MVVPNGTVPFKSVPSHVAYVMFDMRNLDPDPSGRKPDIVFTASGLKFGVCLINQELLKVSGTFARTPLCQPTHSSFAIADCASPQPNVAEAFPTVTNELAAAQDSLQWLLEVGTANAGIESKIDKDVLQDTPKPGRVALRMNLTAGKMTVAKRSFDFRFAYQLQADGTCQALAKAVIITMDDVNTPSTLSFESTSFDGITKHPVLKLVSSTGDLAVLIGNEPPADVEMSVSILRGTPLSSHHEDTTNHMMLVANLLSDTATELVLPAEIPAGACQRGHSFSTPAEPTGDGGTCNPHGMPAMDPVGN